MVNLEKRIDENSQNYACSVIKLGRIHDIPNADVIGRCVVLGNDLVTQKTTPEGTEMLYFQAGTQLSEDMCKMYNLYEDPIMNADDSVKGYISTKRRLVRAIKLRGVVSNGILLPLDTFIALTGYTPQVGDEFTHIGDIEICRKYEVPKQVQGTQVQGEKKPKENRLKDLLIDNQFRFHHETEHFVKNIHKFDLDTEIIITRKYHGSSLILSSVLINKKLHWFEKVYNLIANHFIRGVDRIGKSKYGYIFSSGKPKSRLPKGIVAEKVDWTSHTESFYSQNIWQKAFDMYKDCLEKGITLYGEIVGEGIQGPNYTYGFDYKVFIYRITQTNVDGQVYEFAWEDVKRYCDKYGISYVDELFVGRVMEFAPTIYSEDASTLFVDSLKSKYLDKSYPDCKVDEGVCIRIRETNEIFKLKSPLFILGENAELDKGIENES